MASAKRCWICKRRMMPALGSKAPVNAQLFNIAVKLLDLNREIHADFSLKPNFIYTCGVCESLIRSKI